MHRSSEHVFTGAVRWTGNLGEGTAHYRAYKRDWQIESGGRDPISCSNDPRIGGDPALPNPETLLLSALAACHMLWYLHLASDVGIVILSYRDEPEGVGETASDGAGRFLRATLRPMITVAKGTDLSTAAALHAEVHKFCFIARSVNFPVTYEPQYVTDEA